MSCSSSCGALPEASQTKQSMAWFVPSAMATAPSSSPYWARPCLSGGCWRDTGRTTSGRIETISARLIGRAGGSNRFEPGRRTDGAFGGEPAHRIDQRGRALGSHNVAVAQGRRHVPPAPISEHDRGRPVYALDAAQEEIELNRRHFADRYQHDEIRMTVPGGIGNGADSGETAKRGALRRNSEPETDGLGHKLGCRLIEDSTASDDKGG
jgi:hypothetical protein